MLPVLRVGMRAVFFFLGLTGVCARDDWHFHCYTTTPVYFLGGLAEAEWGREKPTITASSTRSKTPALPGVGPILFSNGGMELCRQSVVQRCAFSVWYYSHRIFVTVVELLLAFVSHLRLFGMMPLAPQIPHAGRLAGPLFSFSRPLYLGSEKCLLVACQLLIVSTIVVLQG